MIMRNALDFADSQRSRKKVSRETWSVDYAQPDCWTLLRFPGLNFRDVLKWISSANNCLKPQAKKTCEHCERWRFRLDSKPYSSSFEMIRQHTQLDNTTHFLMKSNSTDHRPVKHKSPLILSSEHVAFKAVLSVHLCVRDNLSISFLLFAASSRSNHIARWKALAREKRIKMLFSYH